MFKVTHKLFGSGNAVVKDNYVMVEFENGLNKTFVFPDSFEKFLTTSNEYFKIYVEPYLQNKKNERELKDKQLNDKLESIKKITKKDQINSSRMNKEKKSNHCIGKHCKDINIKDKNTLFEIIGYLCSPERIRTIEAIVPDNDYSVAFEMDFPNQKYTKVSADVGSNGLLTKFSPSFRIFFKNIDNCPSVLLKELASGFNCAACLYRTKFVYKLVNDYGFVFGSHQDVSKIRNKAKELGYLEDFERGYNL